MKKKDKIFLIILFILSIFAIFKIVMFYKTNNNIDDKKIINDTIYNKIILDSIEYNIIKRDSIIYKLKTEYKNEIEKSYSLNDSDAINLFYKLVSE